MKQNDLIRHLTDSLQEIRMQAVEYAEMDRDYPTSGAGNLIERIDFILRVARHA